MRLILNTYLIKEMQAVSFSIRLRISSKRDNAYLFGRGFTLGGSLYLDGYLFCRVLFSLLSSSDKKRSGGL